VQLGRGSGTAARLTERSLTALKWSYAGTGTKAVGQFLVGVVLARLLGPEPFGVYAAVLLVTGVGALVVERGFGPALIQTRDVDDEMIRYAFTRLLLTGAAVALLLCAAAHSVAALFRHPALTTAMYGSAAYLFVYSVSVVPGALLRRDLNMRSFHIAQVAAYLLGYGVVGIAGALLGLGAWSLIGALVTQSVVFFVIAYARVRHTVRLLFRLKGQQLTAFGKLVVVTNLLNWAIENLDNFVVGRLYGMHALGLYSVSYNLVRTPTDHVITNAQGVLFSAAARAHENISGCQKAYLAALSAVLVVLCPVFVGIASVAPTVVEGIYGRRWAGAETLMLPLALAMPMQALMTGSALLWARGQVASELKVQAGTLVMFIAGLAAASRISMQAIAWAVLAVYIVRAFWLTSRTINSIQVSWSAVLGAGRGGLFLSAAAAGALFVVNRGLGSAGISALNRLCVLGGVGLVVVTILPVFLPRVIVSKELRTLLERTTLGPLLRIVMQLYVTDASA
jgi:lipopolysaccharide exporter